MIDYGIFSELNEWSVLLRLVMSVLLGGAIGLERGRHGRAAGLRTHVCVTVGSAMASMLGIYMVGIANTGDPTRIASGVVSGVGFLGAGMILVKNNTRVTGLTTAAALWATSTVGLAIGAGFYVGAILAAVLIFLTTTILTIFEVNQKKDARFYLELSDVSTVNATVETIREKFPKSHSFEIIPSKSGIVGHVGIYVNITAEKNDHGSVISELKSFENVIIAMDE